MSVGVQTRPFGFNRVFADVPSEVASHADAAELAMEVELLKAELRRAAEAHAAELDRVRRDGFEAGLAHARAEREEALLAATDALGAGVEALADDLESLRAELQAEAGALALAAAELLAGQTIAGDAAATVDAAIGRVLKQVPRGTELDIRIAPALVGDLEQRIAARQAEDRRRLHLHVIGDADLAEGDARIFWEGGGVVVSRADRAAAVRKELAAILGPAPAIAEMKA